MIAVCFDTESGLVHNSGIALGKQPRLIEFYGCAVEEDGTIIRELHFLCNPEAPIEKEVVRITGITDDMVKDAKTFKEYIPQLQELFSSADAVVAHNLSHDKAIIEIGLQRAGLGTEGFWPKRLICTVEQTEWLLGFRMSLSKLHEQLFNVGFTGQHRAKDDTMALVRCYVDLLRKRII